MFLIPGWLITIVTFPGVVVHEIAHQLFCRICRVAVLDVCYFKLGNPAGYVIHETPRTPMHHLIIGIGPFIVNTIIGAVIAAPGAVPVLQFSSGNVVDYLLIWLGVSIAMHSFPSTGDAKSIWQALGSKQSSPVLRIIATPIVGLIYIGALGSFFWLDLAYGVAVAALIPKILVLAMA